MAEEKEPTEREEPPEEVPPEDQKKEAEPEEEAASPAEETEKEAGPEEDATPPATEETEKEVKPAEEDAPPLTEETEPEEEEAPFFSEEELTALLGDEEEKTEELIEEEPLPSEEAPLEPLGEEKALKPEEILQVPEPTEEAEIEPEEIAEPLVAEEPEEVEELPEEILERVLPTEEAAGEEEEVTFVPEGEEMVALLEKGEEEEKEEALPLTARRREKYLKVTAVILGVLFLAGGLSWWITSTMARRGLSEAEKHFVKGIEFVKANKFNRAEDEFDQGIRLSPKNVEAYNRFGMAYLSVKAYHESLDKAEEALKLDPGNIGARQNMVKVFLAEGNLWDLSKAKEVCREILSIDGKNTETLLDLASVFQQMGWQENAFNTLKGVLSIDPQNIKGLNMLQQIYMGKKQYDQAFGVHRYIIMQLGQRLANIDLLNQLTHIYIERKDLARAEEITNDVLNQEPGSLRARYNLACIMRNKGDVGRALEELKIALDQDPTYAKAYDLSGEIYNQIGMHKQAYNQFKRALELDKEDAQANFHMANLYYKVMNNMPKALIYYEATRRLGLESPELTFNLGATYYHADDYQKALEEWEKLNETENPDLSFNKGNANLNLNQWQKAGDYFQQAIDGYQKQLKSESLEKGAAEEEALFQDLSMAYNNLGIVQEKLKQTKEAMKTYTAAIEAASWGNRQNQKAQANLNRVLQEKPMASLLQAMFSEVKKQFTAR
ncbi:MAG: tetratricopeptide repeat protein [bacterium]